MTAGGIVEPLDIVEHIRPGLVPGALDFARGALGLLRREEAFHSPHGPRRCRIGSCCKASATNRAVIPAFIGQPTSRREALVPAEILPRLGPDRSVLRQAKHRQRKAAQQSSNAVWDAIGHILETVSATACSNYFENAGYDPM